LIHLRHAVQLLAMLSISRVAPRRISLIPHLGRANALSEFPYAKYNFFYFQMEKTASSVLIALVRQGPFQAWSPQVVPLVVLLVFGLQSWFLYLDQKTSSLAEMNRRWLFVTMIVAPDVYYQKTSSSFHGMHSFAIFWYTSDTDSIVFQRQFVSDDENWRTHRHHISTAGRFRNTLNFSSQNISIAGKAAVEHERQQVASAECSSLFNKTRHSCRPHQEVVSGYYTEKGSTHTTHTQHRTEHNV